MHRRIIDDKSNLRVSLRLGPCSVAGMLRKNLQSLILVNCVNGNDMLQLLYVGRMVLVLFDDLLVDVRHYEYIL